MGCVQDTTIPSFLKDHILFFLFVCLCPNLCGYSALWGDNEEGQNEESEPLWWEYWYLYGVLQTLWDHLLRWHILHCHDWSCEVKTCTYAWKQTSRLPSQCVFVEKDLCCVLTGVSLWSVFMKGIHAQDIRSGSKPIHSSQARGNRKISAGVSPWYT